MSESPRALAETLSRLHCAQPWLIDGEALPGERAVWRQALCAAGVPVLELNGATMPQAQPWRDAAVDFSGEFLTPVVLFGGDETVLPEDENLAVCVQRMGRVVTDAAWRQTRQVALTRAVETSSLNQEFRRLSERAGWIRMGWQADDLVAAGNGLVLAWRSPLPLRRIRDFAARCPDMTLIGIDADAMGEEVAAQGIPVSGWRFAVK